MDPYVIYKERDIDGNIVEDGTDNTKVVEQLRTLGFKKVKVENMEQVGWMFSLGLEGKTEEQRQVISYLFDKPKVAGGCFKSAEYTTDEEFLQIVRNKRDSLNLRKKAIDKIGLDEDELAEKQNKLSNINALLNVDKEENVIIDDEIEENKDTSKNKEKDKAHRNIPKINNI